MFLSSWEHYEILAILERYGHRGRHGKARTLGLDISHGCWHGPYSSFNEFRVEIAKVAGISVTDGYVDEPAAAQSC